MEHQSSYSQSSLKNVLFIQRGGNPHHVGQPHTIVSQFPFFSLPSLGPNFFLPSLWTKLGGTAMWCVD